jgi:hypothetical protein
MRILISVCIHWLIGVQPGVASNRKDVLNDPKNFVSLHVNFKKVNLKSCLNYSLNKQWNDVVVNPN